MVRRLLRVATIVVTLLVAWNLLPGNPSEALAQAPPQMATDVFYNYYVPPSGYGGMGAELYVSPRPAPPLVGHTYYTYPPLMPHEFLYRHHRTYMRFHPGGNWTRTHVIWH